MKYREPRIVAIGGGTGLSTVLRGIRQVTGDVTAIVTVADDGGNSGILRDELGVLPPGDFRNCLAALSDSEPRMRELLQYRFRDGSLKGQCVGNLFLVAMGDICGSFPEGLLAMQELLHVKGRVLPVSTDPLTLCAVTESGRTIRGEHLVGLSQSEKHDDRIRRVFLEPQDCRAYPAAVEAIMDADIVVIGPGSLYTSILPDLQVPGITDAIRRCRGRRIYIANIMTQPGETEGYDLAAFVRAIEDHCGPGLFDTVLANANFDIPESLLDSYAKEFAMPVQPGEEELAGYCLCREDLLDLTASLTRHNPQAVADFLRRVWEEM